MHLKPVKISYFGPLRICTLFTILGFSKVNNSEMVDAEIPDSGPFLPLVNRNLRKTLPVNFGSRGIR